jgi:hypothetical protein
VCFEYTKSEIYIKIESGRSLSIRIIILLGVDRTELRFVHPRVATIYLHRFFACSLVIYRIVRLYRYVLLI